ncbi:lipopolysaccharide kinase InaA family protein [Pantoea sp. App145]|uniref:lipopolysaccharide kinase InaA family protein n=1 Tax=Pantoea sp. App145 TaxID=3071567 RepID=UPI003A800379
MKDFNYWWNIEGDPKETKYFNENGFSSYARVEIDNNFFFVKRMQNHLSRSLIHPRGIPTLIQEVNAINHLKDSGVKTPDIIFSSAYKSGGQWKAILVTKEMENFISLKDWYNNINKEINEEMKNKIIREIAWTFRKMHLAKRQHGNCNAGNIFIHTNGYVHAGFIGLENSKKRLTRSQAKIHDFNQLKKNSPMIPKEDWKLFLSYYSQLA